jgi:hypothetical protein
VLPSEGPGGGEPRRSTKKYMRQRGKKHRRGKEILSKGTGPPDGGAQGAGDSGSPGYGVAVGGSRDGGIVTAGGGGIATVTNAAVTKPCERSERGESLSGRRGVSEGIWTNAGWVGSRCAQRAPAWRRAVGVLHAACARDGPSVHLPAIVAGISVTSMTHLAGILRIPLRGLDGRCLHSRDHVRLTW